MLRRVPPSPRAALDERSDVLANGPLRRERRCAPAETDFAGGTSNAAVAEIDPKTNQPLDNGTRELWVTATALSSALNLAYTAEQISLFGIVVGFALLLTGIGLIILAVAVLHRPCAGDERC